MAVAKVCSICSKYFCELREIGPNRLSCGVCRALDRIRGVCLRLPTECSANTLSLLYDTESRLRDLRHFGGELPQGSVVQVEPPAGDSLSSILKGPESAKSSLDVSSSQGAERVVSGNDRGSRSEVILTA